jgi:hypothetical protein
MTLFRPLAAAGALACLAGCAPAEPVFLPPPAAVQQEVNAAEPLVAANWQTLSSLAHGYRLQLPNDWTQVQGAPDLSDSYVAFASPDQALNVTMATLAVQQTSLAAYLTQVDADSQTGYEGQASQIVSDMRLLTIAGEQAIQRREMLLAAGFERVATYIMHNGTVYRFTTDRPAATALWAGDVTFHEQVSSLITFLP